MILNGGAVLSLLTFAAQLMLAERPNVQLVKYVTVAIAFFCLGLIVAAPIYHIRYESSRRHDHPRTKAQGQRYGRLHRRLFVASWSCFVVGVLIALVGMWAVGVPSSS